MFQEKLTVGRFINLNLPLIANIPHLDGDMVATQQLLLTLEQSTKTGSRDEGTRKRESNVVIGQHASKDRRNFQWLPWLPGALTHVAVGGVDVLTGPMSGCDLVLFNLNGVLHAGHLGTEFGKAAANNAIKATWNALATNHPGRVIGRFNPLRDFKGPTPTQQVGKETTGTKVFGLMTVKCQFYTVWCYPQDDNPTQLRIAALQKIKGAKVATAPLSMEDADD
jgi:hypothetical protein